MARAIDAARRAYERWRLVPAPRRAELLFRAAQLIADRKEALARDMTREMGKVLDETRGDVQEAIDMTYFMAGEGRRQYGQTVPSELRDKFAMSVRQPLGVCAIITPWNFPMAIPSWKIIPALVCGNTVVFKPATLTPLSALNFVRILEEAGVPRGVVNLVTGGGGDVGDALLVNDDVRVVSFTGSTDVGRTVSEKAAPSFKKVHLEMGGKNVIMVMDDANLDLAVEGLPVGRVRHDAASAARRRAASSSTSRCIGRFSIGSSRARGRCASATASIPGRRWGRRSAQSSARRCMKYVEIGAKEGATLACGGHALTTGAHAKGFFHEPTIFADVSPQMRIAQEEIFGPVVSASCDATRSRKRSPSPTACSTGLSASIYTQDVNRAFSAMRDVYTGIFYVNAPDDRRRSPPAVRRHEGDRQRPSRGRDGGARGLLGVEVRLRRLQRQAPARANRHGRTLTMRSQELVN